MTTTPSKPVRRRRAQRGSGEQLRAEIIAATKDLLAATGNAEAVSIRSVADAVGVTSPSIYLHFADKDQLLTAVVIDVFAELDVAMVAAVAEVDLPLARLRAAGQAYVRFALSHPEHYRIATMDPCRVPDDMLEQVLQSAAFTHLNDIVVECMAAGVFPDGDPLPITLDLWSAAHGIASLLIVKPFLPWGDPAEVTDRVLCATALGHAAIDLVGGDRSPQAITSWLAGQKRSRNA